MKTVLVFAGTTEGRELIECLSNSNIYCHGCVATEYGNQVLKPSEYVTVHSGRLDEDGMRRLYDSIGCDIVVDATHPYAQMVTETIKKSIEETRIKYLRLLRKNDAVSENADCFEYASVEDCVAGLLKTEGNILLTTGSKQLKLFTDNAALKGRIIARVLPGMESLKLCYDAGLEGRQIIAMQGPFSKEINEATIRDYGIRHLVTKESGVIGGVDTKLEAAVEVGISVHMIKRPDTDNQSGMDAMAVIDTLEQELECKIKRGKVKISLVGIGPGGKDLLTVEAVKAIEEADIIFGAARMLEVADGKAEKYPYYLKKDILPVIEEKHNCCCRDIQAVVLFSGDTGFYSGMSKLYVALKSETDYAVQVMPGISSLSILAARLGTDWQDAGIVSAHGIDNRIWEPLLLASVEKNEKTFFLTSGVRDVNAIGSLLMERDKECKIYLGKGISYDDEQVVCLSPEECIGLTEEGLYSGMIISESNKKRKLVPDLRDAEFIRGNVPMTKEAVRMLSVCKLGIKEHDVVYDIGAGTGSVSVQAAVLSPTVRVYSIECCDEAIALIKENARKAGAKNIEVIQAMAPDGLEGLPKADVCFIGGSKGKLEVILNRLQEINPSMHVVINAVSLESICEMNGLLEKLKVDNLSIEQIAVTDIRELGRYHMLNANNPVFIYAFDFAGNN